MCWCLIQSCMKAKPINMILSWKIIIIPKSGPFLLSMNSTSALTVCSYIWAPGISCLTQTPVSSRQPMAVGKHQLSESPGHVQHFWTAYANTLYEWENSSLLKCCGGLLREALYIIFILFIFFFTVVWSRVIYSYPPASFHARGKLWLLRKCDKAEGWEEASLFFYMLISPQSGEVKWKPRAAVTGNGGI